MRVNYIPVCLATATSSRKFQNVKRFLRKYGIPIKLFICFILVLSLYLGGVLTYMFEQNFVYFRYPPYGISDIRGLVDKIESHETSRYGNFGVDLEYSKHTNNLKSPNRTVGYAAILEAIEQLQKNGDISNRIKPLDQFKDLDFLLDVNQSCSTQWNSNLVKNNHSSITSQSAGRDYVTIVVIVKSAVNYYERRESIRKTWYLNQMVGSYNFKTVFMVGACDQKNPVPAKLLTSKGLSVWTPENCRESIGEESRLYGDIIQSSGIDSYYNNTVKTFMTLRWIHERCSTDYVLAIDDDYVLEIENFLNYTSNIATEYLPLENDLPEPSRIVSIQLEQNVNTTLSGNQQLFDSSTQINNITSRSLEYTGNYILDKFRLIALQRQSKQYYWSGYLLDHVRPLRGYFSKWYISRENYPFDRYPTYLTGGMHMMSLKTARQLYYGTYFTSSYIYDDVYLGIVAEKVHIEPVSCPEFKCDINKYLKQKPIRPNSTNCLGVHDIPAKSLLKLWDYRKQYNNQLLLQQQVVNEQTNQVDFDALLN